MLVINSAVKNWLCQHDYSPPDGSRFDNTAWLLQYKRAVTHGIAGHFPEDEYNDLLRLVQVPESEVRMTTTNPTADKNFRGGAVNVKAPSQSYSAKRYSAKHSKTGAMILDEYGAEVTRPSQLSMAKTGALLKQAARRSGLQLETNDHERALLHELVECDTWASFNGEPHENKLYAPGTVKTLMDDATSGGLEITPIEFDADVISYPLLNGELLPHVDLKPVSRGRRIEGGAISNPTANWGGGDDQTGNLFTTTSMVTPLDTTIFTIDVFVEVGRDFLSDSPVNVRALLTQIIGERFQAELDKVIAKGNGTTQPQGITVASGTTSVSFSNAAATVGKYESLLFGIPKQYRTEAMRACFCSNEVSYRCVRAIPVGASDERRVFGMTHEDYKLFARPHLISADLANTALFFGAMSRYRLYRRLGMSVEWHTQGSTLARKNLALLAVRGRFGGRVMDPSAFAVVTDAQA